MGADFLFNFDFCCVLVRGADIARVVATGDCLVFGRVVPVVGIAHPYFSGRFAVIDFHHGVLVDAGALRDLLLA